MAACPSAGGRQPFCWPKPWANMGKDFLSAHNVPLPAKACVGYEMCLATKSWAQSTSQDSTTWNSSCVPQPVGFLMWLLGLKLQHKCRHFQDSFHTEAALALGSQPQLCRTGMETQRDSSGRAGISSTTLSDALSTDMGSPLFSKAGAWLLQLKGSRTTVLPFRGEPSILPRLAEKKTREPQGSARNQAMDRLGATQLMERLFLQGFGCFSSLNSWSRAEGTESQGRSGVVCLLMFLSKHSHSPLLSHTTRLRWLRCAPRAGISQTHRHCQENLIQPTGGSSALLITCTITTFQVLRPPECAALKAYTASGSVAPHLGRGDYFIL